MRLTHLYVENFQGLKSCNLDLSAPITLVCGANGAGKSSLQEAINLALGGSARVALKKHYKQLVTEGSKKAQIILSHDGVTSSYTLPDGKGDHSPAAGDEFLPYVLTPSLFANLPDGDRRKALFALTKSSSKPQVVADKLLSKGAEPAKVEKIKPMLIGGFPAAQQQAKDYASESRGAWKALTGEQYGSEKSEDWTVEVPVGPVITSAEINKVIAEHGGITVEIEKGVKYLGALEEKQKATADHAARIETLTEAAALLSRAKTKLDSTSKDLAGWEEKHQQLTTQLELATYNVAGCDCPSCGVKLKIVGKTVELYQGLVGDTKQVTDLALELSKAKSAIELLKRTQHNDQAAMTTAENAAAELAELQKSAPEVISAEQIGKTEEALTDLRLKADNLRAKVNAMKDRQDLVANAQKTNDTAAAHHADVKAWTLIADLLAPDGIPSEILAGALQPINDSLAKASALARWRPVEIGADMSISAGGRLYALLSESERWRVDALLALVIAEHSGLRFLILDRYDVLDLPGRGELLGMLVALAKTGAVDSAIVCGTLKTKPDTSKSPEISAVWIEGGVAAGDQPLQQAS
jgi:hypothetical protein